jgi:hypothetical protein
LGIHQARRPHHSQVIGFCAPNLDRFHKIAQN